MNRRILAAAFLLAGLCSAQEAPSAFEVASVKRSAKPGRPSVVVSPTSVTLDGNLGYILQWAYEMKRYQVSGPDWVRSESYHVAAKTSAPAAPAELRLMLRSLIDERFKLVHHSETKEFTVYALEVGPDGPKLTESRSEGESVTTNNAKTGSGGTSVRTSMAQLADLLDGSCPEPVVDLTGLKGRYDFKLDISAYLPITQSGDLPVILRDALRKQLGITLEYRKIKLETLVIERGEKLPAEN